MKHFRNSVLIALVLMAASVVVAAPAFATPRLTESTGSSAVSPFITPIGTTTSTSVGTSTNSNLALPSSGSTVSCTTSTVSGYVDRTHTQLKLTAVSFGGGDAARNCRVAPAGRVDNTPDITCTATSAAPWFLHVRTVISATSSSGTVNLTSSCTVRLTITGRGDNTVVSIDAGQSCQPNAGGNTYTSAARSLVVDCRVLATINNPRLSTQSTFRGTYSIRPTTARDANLTVTAAS